MKKFWQKVVSTAFAGTLLLSSFLTDVNVAHAASPIVDTITLSVRFPDSVGEDENGRYGVEPTDPYVIFDMVRSEGKNYPTRSGWSAGVYQCMFTEIKDSKGEWITVSDWELRGTHYTVDSHVSHPATKLRDSIIKRYGQELYNLAVANNAMFTYDPTTEVPAKYLNPNTPIGRHNLNYGYTRGRYSVYAVDTRYWNSGYKKCSYPGELAYWYNNNEFFVKSTINLTWYDNGPKGSTYGETYWELERTNPNGESEVAVHSQYRVPYEQHVGVRNIRHTVSLGSKTVTKNTDGSIDFNMNAQSVRNKNLSYSFSYEYTNKEIGWVCRAYDEFGCKSYVWDSSPDWRAVQTFRISSSMPVDHRQGEVVKGNKLDDVLRSKFIVGRKDSWSGTSKTSKTYYEEWRRASDNNIPTRFDLKTQSHLPILQGALDYQVEVPSGKHRQSSYSPLRKEWSYGHYFPADVDDSLKSDYRNTTEYKSYDYMFPLQQSVMQNNGLVSDKRSYRVDFTTDLFLMSEHTGLIVGVPYAQGVKQNIINNRPIPSPTSYISQGESKLKTIYEQTTGQTYRDNAVDTDSSKLDRLQRYYLPIDSTSKLHPGNTYKNHIVYKNMGLSDISFEFDQTFTFKHYLFGTPKDDAWIVEQVAERSDMMNVSPSQIHVIHMTNEQVEKLAKLEINRTKVRVHEFRRSDRTCVDQVKSIIGDLGL
ncbi:hypothetical protein [Ureibacillus sp. FSL W8-0352]|uniref:hypothetical protein n=1 Tax=Ureibacillus sp. FSL W8-0352 TaxID=2954596 RepID=UPI0030F4DC27